MRSFPPARATAARRAARATRPARRRMARAAGQSWYPPRLESEPQRPDPRRRSGREMQNRTGRNRATRPGPAWMAFWLYLASWSAAQEPEGQSGSPGPPPVAEVAPTSAPKVEPLADPTPRERTGSRDGKN